MPDIFSQEERGAFAFEPLVSVGGPLSCPALESSRGSAAQWGLPNLAGGIPTSSVPRRRRCLAVPAIKQPTPLAWATDARGIDKLGLGCDHAFRPPRITNDCQHQKGSGEHGERWRKRDWGNYDIALGDAECQGATIDRWFEDREE